MRQLLYHWQFANDVYYSIYDESLSKISYDFSKTNWPIAGQPFSIFTSSYGSAGKTLQTGFGSNQPTKNWDRKQISQPPKVAADQFVVLNNVSSTPGVLPTPTIIETNAGWDFTFEIFLKAQGGIPTVFIWDLQYTGVNGNEPADYSSTADRLKDATKSYYKPSLVKPVNTVENPTGFVLIARDYLDIQKIFQAFLDPVMVYDVKVLPVGGVTTTQGITSWTVNFSLPRFGVTQPVPAVNTTFAPSKVDRRRTVEATRTPTPNLGKYYENIAPNGFVQLVINDTNYFQEPIHTQALGISGDAAPFPQQVGVQVPHWSLKPNFYVLPGQTWDVKYTTMNDIYALEDYIATTRVVNDRAQIGSYWTYAEVFLSYYLFEGANAMICHQLLKLGITINPDSVNWYKQQILEMEGLDPKTYEVYLDLQREWQAKQKRLDDHYLRGRKK